MDNINKKKRQKIGIFGLGKTGNSVFEYFKDTNKSIICYDDQAASRKNFSHKYGAEFIVELNSPQWHFLDFIVVSPGVDQMHNIFVMANNYRVPIISDIDIFYQDNPDALFIAITGTNGKSTSSALIAHILVSNKADCALGGNIGVPILSLPKNKKIYVLELSSFQLDLIKFFKAHIVILLNITPDHLDRYQTIENYTDSKKQIFSLLCSQNNLPSAAIICTDQPNLQAIYQQLKTTTKIQVLAISSQHKIAGGVACLPNIIEDDISNLDIISYSQNNYLPGAHNRENIASSFATCRLLGLSAKQITAAIDSFKSLPHRMQYLGNIGNIYFYNDSKATNAESSSMALKSLGNIFWLSGGVLKSGGITSLQPYFKKVSKAYFYGSNKQIFAEQFGRFNDLTICQDLAEAFKLAFTQASVAAAQNSAKINILLSPASSSYDQYKNFEERGEHFRQLFMQAKQFYDRTS